MIQFPPKKFGNSDRKILEYLGVNLRIAQRIRKVLDAYNGNYECTAGSKPHSHRSGKKKRTNLREKSRP